MFLECFSTNIETNDVFLKDEWTVLLIIYDMRIYKRVGSLTILYIAKCVLC